MSSVINKYVRLVSSLVLVNKNKLHQANFEFHFFIKQEEENVEITGDN